jgi:hypothetical protein
MIALGLGFIVTMICSPRAMGIEANGWSVRGSGLGG